MLEGVTLNLALVPVCEAPVPDSFIVRLLFRALLINVAEPVVEPTIFGAKINGKRALLPGPRDTREGKFPKEKAVPVLVLDPINSHFFPTLVSLT
jgi:hypothetical protein